MLPWLTTVLTLAFLALSASNRSTAVPGRVLGDDLVAVLGVAVAVLQVQPQLLFTVVDLRALDVVAVDLGHRHRRVDGLVSAGVVAEIEERPAQQQHHRDRGERADHIFPVHQGPSSTAYSAACGQCPSIRAAGIVKATARPTFDSSRRLPAERTVVWRVHRHSVFTTVLSASTPCAWLWSCSHRPNG